MRSFIIGGALVMSGLVIPAAAQETPDWAVGEFVTYPADSGVRSHAGASLATVYEETVQLDGAQWLRLYFGSVDLEEGSFVRITSILDGEVQELDAGDLEMWSYTSAYFNGDSVILELIAGPETSTNRVVLDHVAAYIDSVGGEPRGCGWDCGICGSDNRVPSDEDWSGRLMPVGCTGAIYNEQSCAVSAGHCMTSGLVIQFRVPDSTGGCSPINPPVEEQFPITSFLFTNGGIGNDWAAMTTGTNNLGQTPFGRYGVFRPIATSPPSVGQAIGVWGFGIDGDPGQCNRSQTQQTHSATVSSVSSTFFNHFIDITCGSSGSSVIRSGEILGIVTHCPCPGWATRMDHAAFAAARESLCPTAECSPPDCDDGNPCTDDFCDGGTCVHTNNTDPCDDGEFCNGADTCSGGSCSVHAGNPCPGADGDSDCSEGCNETQNNCTANDPNGSSCDDGQFCNGSDTCSNGGCTLHSGDPCASSCSDGDDDCSECCNETQDDCTADDPNGSSCNDGQFCNGSDTCSNGGCTQHSGDPCPDQVCDEDGQTCLGCADGSDCDDGAFCNGVEACVGQECQPGVNPCGPEEFCDEAGDTCLVVDALMTCQLSSTGISPLGSVDLEVFLEDVSDLRGYEVVIAITRTSGSGEVTVDCPGGVVVDTTREDYVFFNADNDFPFTDCLNLRAGAAVLSGGVDVGFPPVYLANYTLNVSADAEVGSTFEVSILPDPNSALRDSNSDTIPFAIGPACTLTVTGARMHCELLSSVAAAGGSATVDLFVAEASDLRGYETTIVVTRTSGTGEVTVECPEGVEVDQLRPDYVFFEVGNDFVSVDCPNRRATAVLLEGGVDVGETPAYMSTYHLTVSPDAALGSTFEITILPDPNSALRDSNSEPIPFAIEPACTLTVADARMSCELTSNTASVGGNASVDLFVQEASDLRGYETTIAITRTSGTGEVTVECPDGVEVDQSRKDYVFFEVGGDFIALDCPNRRATAALLIGGVDVGPTPAYMATYYLTVSPDATPDSTFDISILPAPNSALRDSNSEPIAFGVEPACTLTITDCDTPAMEAHGPRYLGITPAEGTAAVALLITSDDWTCLSEYVQADGSLGPGPVSQTPDQWSTVFVTGEAIAPSSSYNVQAECGAGTLSGMATATTSLWGDLNDDALVNIDDILCELDGFAHVFPFCTFEDVNIDPCEGDDEIDLDDILDILDAFAGLPYPCLDPCP